MARRRPTLGNPVGTDGPWLAELVNIMSDMFDLLDARLPKPQATAKPDGGGNGGGPVRVSEPAPASPPPAAVPVTEPAPEPEPDVPNEDEPEKVEEPAPDVAPALLEPPPRAGRGSSLEAWQAFAEAAGVPYPEDATRNDIIAACEAAEVIEAG